jgi:hypothetical protein
MFYEVSSPIRDDFDSSNELQIIEIEEKPRTKILYEVPPPLATPTFEKYSSNEIIIEEPEETDYMMAKEKPIFLVPKKKEPKPINNIFIRMEMPKPELNENPDYEILSKKIDKIVDQVSKPIQFNLSTIASKRMIKQDSEEALPNKDYKNLSKKIDALLEHVAKPKVYKENIGNVKTKNDQILPKKSTRLKKQKREINNNLKHIDPQSDQKIDKIESLDPSLLDKFLSNKFDKIKRDSELKEILEPAPAPSSRIVPLKSEIIEPKPVFSSRAIPLASEIQIPDEETVSKLSLVKPTYINLNENSFVTHNEYFHQPITNYYEKTTHISSKNRPILLSLTISASIIFIIQGFLFSSYSSSCN